MILVTGGTGFVGRQVVKRLLDNNENVVVFSERKHDKLEDLGAKFVLGDIRNIENIRGVFKKYNIDVVYHLAADIDEQSSDMWSTNVDGTRNVVEVCKENKVKQIIFLSSIGVLGEATEPLKENDPYNPDTLYEESKVAGENLILFSGVPFTIIRASIIIGPNDVWLSIFKAAKKGYPIIGSGKNYFHLTALNDVVHFLVFAKQNPKTINQIFHIATADTPTYEEVYRMICDSLGIEMTNKHISITTAKILSFFYRIKSIFGKQPLITRSSSIRRLTRNRLVSTEKISKIMELSTTRSAIEQTAEYFLKNNMLEEY
jgi:nucleoside-diphosphate-sugar epimerase